MRVVRVLKPAWRALALAIALAAPAVARAEGAVESSPPVDVQFFWQAPTERAALAELRRAFERRGGVWVDFPTRNASENRSMAFQRIIQGIAPFAVQWHAGYDLRIMSDSGVIHDITPIANEMHWAEILHANILPFLGEGGAEFGLPVGIHAENWAWFNSALVRRYGDAAPGDWEAVEALLARAAEAGGPGIAMGTEPWQRMLLLSQILVGEGGAGAYRELHEHGDQASLDDPAFRRALGIFARLRRFDRHSPDVRSWRDGTVALARGKAVVQFMGDWVLPELAAMDALPGRDFECVLAIGREKRHLSVIDAFIFPRQNNGGLTVDHRRLAAAVLEPDTQISFAQSKGAIPVRAGLGDLIQDPCLRPGYDLYKSPGASVPAAVMIARERPLAGLVNSVSAFWDDPGRDTAAGLRDIRRALAAAQ